MKKWILLAAELLLVAASLCFLVTYARRSAETAVETTAETDAETTAEETTTVAPEETEEAWDPSTEYFLEKEEGYNQLTLYWYKANANIDTSDVWIWWDGVDGRGYPFYPCSYGFKCMVNVPEDIEQVGFIVRVNCSDPCGTSWGEATKDYADDRFAVITSEDTVIYLKTGDGNQYTSADGGVTLEQIRLFSLCGMISMREIKYVISPAVSFTSLDQIHVYQGNREIEIENLSSLNNSVILGIITVAEDLDVTKQYTVELEGYGSHVVMPTDIFDSEEFIENYTYDGDDLGAIIHDGTTTFKVWAPTASAVVLNLFEAGDGCDAYEQIEMTLGEKGVWSAEAECGHGTYYTYSVTTAVGTQEAVDPYAKAVGVNGNRGMVIDLDTTDPEGFDEDTYYDGLESYQDAVIWEVHVRDFSNNIETSQYKGKYLAFTETGLTNSSGVPVGVDYLVNLGVTHVHLQPVYDYATVDETSSEPQFNWGYDPKNYNAPEGSYSTDPYRGEVRVNEFKQMVQSLHEQGLGVIMDVVYNHTYDVNSNLNKIVPYYYYRYTALGKLSNGSGVGNETASDRVMFRKYMVDSVTYWATEYHLDGFRFDLMALHDIETMQEIEEALHAINPKAIIYGEGWTGGTSALNSALQASQANIFQVTASEGAAGSIAVFNDSIRDGLKGSVFTLTQAGYINGSATRENANKVIFGLRGGLTQPGTSWSVKNNMVINYMSCHDNSTLWDKLLATCPDATTEELLAMNRLGAAVVLIAKGTPFMLAGEEMLRTKDGDTNSYASSDAINNLDWEALTADSDNYRMMLYYKSLIAMRKANPFLKDADVTCTILDENVIEAVYTQDGATIAVAVINPLDEAVSYTLPDGSWGVLVNGETVASVPEETLEGGEVSVGAKSVLLVTVQ